MSHILAREWTRAGHPTTVVTNTSASVERSDIEYKVVRNPDSRLCEDLVMSHDIVHANTSSPRLLQLAKRHGKPFSWTHANYRLCAIDGLGWDQGEPAPLVPWQSVLHHLKLYGPLPAIKGAVKLSLLQLAAKQVDANVQITRHMAHVQPLPREHIIYNPFDKELFEAIRQTTFNIRKSATTFTFVGRLVSEKGPFTLLDAFAQARKLSNAVQTLKFIGLGPDADNLKERAEALNISEFISWTAATNDAELKSQIGSAGICVIPSYFQEPMGIVALELMTCGKPLIVSETGGLSEVTGDAALTFPNGDANALAREMVALAEDPLMQQKLVDNGFARLPIFDPELSIRKYIDLFSSLIRKI